MRRALLSLSLVSSLSLAACGEEEGKAPGGQDEPEGDTHVIEDDIDEIDPVYDFVDAALLTSSPATLPATTGGSVRFTLRAAARTEEGEDATLADAAAEGVVHVNLEDGTELPASFELIDDQTIAVTVEVEEGFGADLGAGHGRQPLTVWIGDAFLAEVPLTRHLDADTGAQQLMGEGRDVLVPSAPMTVCDWTLADTDEDGVAEVVSIGITEDGDVVGSACLGFFDADPPEWECEDTTLEVPVEDGEDLFCGDVSHFKTKDGGVGTVMAAQTSGPRTIFVHLPTFDHRRGGWITEGGSWDDSRTMALSAIVIGMNTSKEDAGQPLEAVLSIRGGDGRWGGRYEAGREPWEWSRIGTITPAAIGEGKAWAGLFGTADLSGADPSDPSSWVWTVDPSKLSGGGKLAVGVSRFDSSSGAFLNVRQIEIAPPAFTPELATASGEDIDGDGHPELIVEAWGEGRHAAWIVPGATDKANTRPITELTGATGDRATVVAPMRVSGDGAVVVGVPTFKLDGNGKLLSELEELVAEKGLSFGMDLTPYLETPRIQVVQGWDAAEALSEDVSALGPEFAGVVGGGDSGGTSCKEGETPSTSGRGVCHRGRCFCVPGHSGRLAASVGGGSTTTAPGAPLAPGDVALLGTDPSGGALVLTRTTDAAGEGAGWPIVAMTDEMGGVSVIEGVYGADGPVLQRDGEELMSWNGGSSVSVARGGPGDLGVFVFEPQLVEAATREEGDPTETMTVEVTLRVRYADQTSGRLQLPTETTTAGSTVPAMLDRRISDEGGVLFGWRDGEGQAWLGVVDIQAAASAAEGAVPFVQGPVAVGDALNDPDADGVLGWTSKSAGIVGVKRIIADTPFFSMEDLEERFSSWDTPMEGAIDATEAGYGPVVLSIGNDGFQETVYLAAFPDIAELSMTTLYSTTDVADLPVPRVAARLVPDAPQVVVSTNAAGGVSLDLVDGTRPLAQQWHAFDLDPGVPVSAGDLNGDGIADLVTGQGMDAVVVLSDGQGGVLGGGGPDPAYFTSFAVLLGGADGTSECKLDEEGSLSQTRGRALHGAPLLGER